MALATGPKVVDQAAGEALVTGPLDEGEGQAKIMGQARRGRDGAGVDHRWPRSRAIASSAFSAVSPSA